MGSGVVPTNSKKSEMAWHIRRLQAMCPGNPQGRERERLLGRGWPKSRGL